MKFKILVIFVLTIFILLAFSNEQVYSQSYNISGSVFDDKNENGILDATEATYSGTITINGIPFSDGNYSIENLVDGEVVEVSYSNPPPNFNITWPGTFYTSVKVGSGCDEIQQEGKCVSGNVSNLNFGISDDPLPWLQSTGVNMRIDNGYHYPLPSGKFASIDGSGGTPGIIFSGTVAPNFGDGGASNPENWKISGTSWESDVYSLSRNSVPTSYEFLLATAEGSGISRHIIKSFIDCLPPTWGYFSCRLNQGTINGNNEIYIADNNFTLVNANNVFDNGNDFIILIDGNLTIKTNIDVTPGTTLIFSARGDIIIDKDVDNLEGFYSANHDFIIQSANSCDSVPDKNLNIQGTVIANAALNTLNPGKFINQRSLCDSGNATSPTVTFTERLDFIVNYPDFVKFTPRVWQEVPF